MPGQCCHLPLITRLVVPPLKTKPGTEPLSEPSSAENSSHESTHGKCVGGLSRLRAVISTRPSNVALAQRLEQVGALVAKDLVARERLGEERVHRLFAARGRTSASTVNRSCGSTVLPIGTTLMRLCRSPSSTNQPMTGSQSGLACRTARCGCDSAYGIGFGRARVARQHSCWLTVTGHALRRRVRRARTGRARLPRRQPARAI